VTDTAAGLLRIPEQPEGEKQELNEVTEGEAILSIIVVAVDQD